MSAITQPTPVSIQDFAAALRRIPAEAFHGGGAVLDFLKSAPVVQDSLAPDSCMVYSPERGTCGEIKLHYTTQFGKPPAPR